MKTGKLLKHQKYEVEKSPAYECPVSAVPESRAEPYDKDVSYVFVFVYGTTSRKRTYKIDKF